MRSNVMIAAYDACIILISPPSLRLMAIHRSAWDICLISLLQRTSKFHIHTYLTIASYLLLLQP